MLERVRNIRVEAAFASLHCSAEVAILNATRLGLHVTLIRSKVIEGTLHILARRLYSFCFKYVCLLTDVDGLLFLIIHRNDVSPIRHS